MDAMLPRLEFLFIFDHFHFYDLIILSLMEIRDGGERGAQMALFMKLKYSTKTKKSAI